MKLINKALLTFISVLAISMAGFSQSLPPPKDVPCNPELDPLCVPITDHIGWLVSALIVFGIFKTIQYSRKSVNA